MDDVNQHDFRGLGKMEYAEDFQRAGRNESALVEMQSQTLGEYDESVHTFREDGKLSYVDDFQRTSLNETVMIGLKRAGGSGKHAPVLPHAFRDVEKIPHGDDFQRTGVDETAMVGRDPARLGEYMMLSRTLLVLL